MNLSWGANSDVGRVRSVNEDSYLTEAPLFVVADGMGGHSAGDVASATAIEAISQGARGEADPALLGTLLRDANAMIWGRAQSDPNLQGMGTTCTLAYIDGGYAHLAHVGDSRAYLLRDGSFEQLTEDHTLVWRLVQEGKLQPEEAQHHPQRSIITRALGVDEEVEVDTHTLDLEEGDRLLLCSDGLTSMVDEEQVAAVLQGSADPQTAADRLVDIANDAGGEDNITAVVIDVASTSGRGARGAAATEMPRREDTPVARAQPGPMARRGSPGMLRRLLVGGVVVVALAGLAFGAARYAIANSWYVGTTDDGTIAVFRGIPEDIAGLTLREVEESTDLTLSDLPEFRRETVASGIKADSLTGARRIVADLRRIAEDEEFRPRARPGD